MKYAALMRLPLLVLAVALPSALGLSSPSVMNLAAAAALAALLPQAAVAALGPSPGQQAAFGFDAPSEETRYFDQKLTHFDSAVTATWKQAYYVNDDHYEGGAAPIFLYIGGEGPQNAVTSNFLTDVLARFGALLIAVEHRYYGCGNVNHMRDNNVSSCPYSTPEQPFNAHLKHLSSREALADLAYIHDAAPELLGVAADARWIGVGGSYPGMLAAFLRATYPDKFFMSVASSAPVHGVLDMTSFEDIKGLTAYTMDVEGVRASPACAQAIKDGHAEVHRKLFGGANTTSGREELVSLFPGSLPQVSYLDDETNRRTFAGCGVAFFPAQSNDPQCRRVGARVCISEICELMTDPATIAAGQTPIQRLANLSAIQRAAGGPGGGGGGAGPKELDTGCEMDWETPNPGVAAGDINYWGYQTCTEFGFYQTCEAGSKCMYTEGIISFDGTPGSRATQVTHKPNDFCQAQFGLSSSTTNASINDSNAHYMGLLADASRIIWVNGDVDPWHLQSNLKGDTAKLQPSIFPVKGAHHCAWMSATHKTDQRSLVEARAQIFETVEAWLKIEPAKSTAAPPPKPTTLLRDVETPLYFDQAFDHFNAEGPSGTWRQRYYVNTTYYTPPADGEPAAPLFFIPGGEWSVTPTKGILYGMAHDLAREHGGLMAIVEHRFYGASLPFGPTESFVASPDRIGLLTVEQAMADYAAIITSIQAEHKMVGAPVVSLGGSYSGKLSAYMRLKYPFIVSIALAASAPIYLDSVGLTDPYAYYEVVENATAKISPTCPAAVRHGSGGI